MHKFIVTEWSMGILARRTLILFTALFLLSSVLPPASSHRGLMFACARLLTLTPAFAQSINPQAKSKYDAGLAAMARGDCAAARALLQQAIALDPTDRSVKVGMFSTDYRPNASLRALEAKCPSTRPTSPPSTPPATPPSTPPSTPPPAPPTTQPMVLTVVSPRGSGLTVQSDIDSTTVQGSIQGGQPPFTVAVNGRDVPVGRDGHFATTVPLSVGANQITVRASDSSRKTASKSIAVKRLAAAQPAPPPAPTLELTVLSPADPKETVSFETESITVKGSVKSSDAGEKVLVNGKTVPIESNGAFSTVVPMTVGSNKIVVRATAGSAPAKERQFTVTRLAAPPAPPAPLALTVTSPGETEQSVAFETDKIALAGTVTGGSGTPRLTVNDKTLKPDSRGAFSTSVPLAVGDNAVTVRVRDSAGKEAVQELRITRLPKVYPPPVLTLTAPEEGRHSVPFETDRITVRGSAADGEGPLKLRVNDQDVKLDARGTFSTSLQLATGDNRITVAVSDAAGRESAREIHITRLPQVFPPPVLSLTSPAEPALSVPFETDKITLKGSVSGGESPTTLTVNDQEIKAGAQGDFATTRPLQVGDNRFLALVKDAGGKEDRREIVVTRQPKVYPPPVLAVTSPSEPAPSVPFETDKITVKGTVSEGEGTLKVTVNGKDAKPDSSGAFSAVVPLNTGGNAIAVQVKDAAGREDRKEFRVTRKEEEREQPLVLRVNPPAESGQDAKVSLSGTVAGGRGPLKLIVDGQAVAVGDGGAFDASVTLRPGKNRILLRVEDAAGKHDSQIWFLFHYPAAGK